MALGRGGLVAVWGAANLVLGVFAAIPLVTAAVFSYYVRAKVWGTVSAPYHGAEAGISVAIIVLGGAAVAAAVVVGNRALCARLRLACRGRALFWVGTTVLVLLPFLIYLAWLPT